MIAGGLGRAVEKYDTDYWCLTYKEGAEWLLRRYAGSNCPEKIRVAGHSILLQTSYYLKQTEEGRRLFMPVSLDDRPNFAMATTRFGDHRRTPGRLVHTVYWSSPTTASCAAPSAPGARGRLARPGCLDVSPGLPARRTAAIS